MVFTILIAIVFIAELIIAFTIIWNLVKLDKMLTKMDAGTLDFTPKCSKAVLLQQKRHMSDYIRDLEVRAEIEGISLE